MKALSGGLLGFAVSLLIAAGGVLGWLGGVALAERLNEPDVRVLDVRSPEAHGAARQDGGLRSSGGFTGFGGLPALSGWVIRSGEVSEHEEGRLVVAQEGAELAVGYSATTRLYRVVTGSAPLVPGDVVVLRLDGDQPTGLLRIRAEVEVEPDLAPADAEDAEESEDGED